MQNKLFLVAIGQTIENLRDSKGLSKHLLAIKAGIKPSQLADIEAGNVNVTISTLNRLATSLDISMLELLMEIDYH